MSEKTLRRWITVSDYMNSEYREHVVKMALAQREHASLELRKMANSALSNVAVPGFRNFLKVPVSVAVPYVVKQFYKRREVTVAIISLWAEACQDIIDDLKSHACAQGLSFKEPWTWKEAQLGYFDYGDISELDTVVELFVAEKERLEHDHLKLAELWLSAAFIDPEPTGETPPQTDVANPVLEVRGPSAAPLDQSDHEVATPAEQDAKPLQDISTVPLIDLPSTTEANQEDKWDTLSLVDLIQQGEQIRLQVETFRTNLLASTQCLHQAVGSTDLPTARDNINNVLAYFNDWQNYLNQAESLANYGIYRLQREFSSRPDMNHLQHLEQAQLMDLKAGFQAVMDYDAQKEATLKALEQLQAEKSAAEKEWLEWQDNSNTTTSIVTPITTTDVSEMTLTFLREQELHLHGQIAELRSHSLQARKASLDRIHSDLQKLLELNDEKSSALIDGKTLEQINSVDYSLWNGLQLRHLEAELQKALTSRITKAKSSRVIDYSTALANEWSDERFYDLLNCLTAEHRDADVFLVLMAAGLSRANLGTIVLSHDIYSSMLSGLLSFSNTNQLSDFVSQVLPTLVSTYLLEDKRSTLDLCLISLAVHYSASYHLPEGLLWHIATDWPVGNMPGWNKLWQCALMEVTCPIYTDHKQTQLREKLAQARAKAEKDFARDGAHFVRLSSLQSYRHLGLMNRLLQSLVEKFDVLKRQDGLLAKARPEQLQNHVLQLANMLRDDLDEALAENKLHEMYEAGVRVDKIDDSNPFHQRISLRILHECALSIKEYGEALLELWDLVSQRITGLDSETLTSELDSLTNLSSLAKMGAEQMIQSQQHSQKTWDQTYCMEELKSQLVGTLLTQPNLILRLPRLVCHVVDHSLQWDEVFRVLLQDLAGPLEPAEIAAHLIAHRASNQVLGLVQFIPLDLQNHAQSLQSENEHLSNQLTLELLNLGGKSEDLRRMREIGRWGWLHNELKTRIEVLRLAAEADARDAENRARTFRKTIQDLDDAIFDKRPQISHDVYNLVQRGLALARQAYSNKDFFSSLEEYLGELQYRITHNSWPLLSLEQATERLEKSLANKQNLNTNTMSAERVLEILERNELAALGLSKIDASEANTRINLLANWLKLKKIHSILGKDLLQTEISAIQSVFSWFARMMSMSRFHTPHGKSLDTVDPIVYEYWEMRYPRTNALDNQYVLITLPGATPSTRDLQTIEDILEEKEFLEYYFVLLFVTDGSEKVYKRLQRKGLVIIDERRLLDMIVAEANGNRPLGVLRPMVLTAVEANADIFITNQSVSARTAIFVGRDSLVDRIVNSGDNYAIYGGRRIGKSSVLKAVEQRLVKRSYRVLSLSLEGEKDFRDEYISWRLAQMLGLDVAMANTGNFKQALVDYMENNPELKVAILLDEIDRYITVNSERHTLIEALRASSDRFGNRFRVIIAGFMNLYDCLHGHGPYTPNSDPWQRMFTDNRELENLTPVNAEEIVREGFVSILGWKFDHWAIPQRIVERTGGHPAFVQMFCFKLLERVRPRKDHIIYMNDVEAVFNDLDPRNSFIAYVRETLNLNLEPISNYLIFWLAADVGDASGFTLDRIRNVAKMSSIEIPEDCLKRSLELLKVTSVIRERMPDVFDFTVPDYASILNRLGDTAHLDDLDDRLRQALK